MGRGEAFSVNLKMSKLSLVGAPVVLCVKIQNIRASSVVVRTAVTTVLVLIQWTNQVMFDVVLTWINT